MPTVAPTYLYWQNNLQSNRLQKLSEHPLKHTKAHIFSVFFFCEDEVEVADWWRSERNEIRPDPTESDQSN
jgi:hypothetical protein